MFRSLPPCYRQTDSQRFTNHSSNTSNQDCYYLIVLSPCSWITSALDSENHFARVKIYRYCPGLSAGLLARTDSHTETVYALSLFCCLLVLGLNLSLCEVCSSRSLKFPRKREKYFTAAVKWCRGAHTHEKRTFGFKPEMAQQYTLSDLIEEFHCAHALLMFRLK